MVGGFESIYSIVGRNKDTKMSINERWQESWYKRMLKAFTFSYSGCSVDGWVVLFSNVSNIHWRIFESVDVKVVYSLSSLTHKVEGKWHGLWNLPAIDLLKVFPRLWARQFATSSKISYYQEHFIMLGNQYIGMDDSFSFWKKSYLSEVDNIICR